MVWCQHLLSGSQTPYGCPEGTSPFAGEQTGLIPLVFQVPWALRTWQLPELTLPWLCLLQAPRGLSFPAQFFAALSEEDEMCYSKFNCPDIHAPTLEVQDQNPKEPSQNHVVFLIIFPLLSIPHGNHELWIMSKASPRGS